MTYAYLAALMGSTALLSTAALAQTNAPAQPGARPAQTAPAQTVPTGPGAPAAQAASAAQANVCQELVTFLDRRGTAQPASPVTTDQARTFQRANDVVACRDGLVRIQGAGIQVPAALALIVQQPATGASTTTPGTTERITVQQPAATLQVEQAPPQVTVQQAQPQVTVRQAQPEIIVRQAPPTITVQMPNPEIIVRMPEPEVNVTQGRPEVQVNVSAPTVSMVQPTAQPQVQVQPSQAQVTVQRPQGVAGQDNVDIQRAGAPIVRFERMGEARVVMNQQEGQPNIRFEQAGQANPQANARPGQVLAQAPVAPVPAATGNQVRPILVSQILGKDVYNLRNEDLGEVENLVLGEGNQVYAVVKFGEFLGLGGEARILPLNRMQLREDRIIIPGMTEVEFRALPAYRQGLASYRVLDRGYRFDFPLFAAAAPVGGTFVTAGSVAVPAAGTAAPAAGPARTILTSQLEDMNVYNLRGENLGEVDDVLIGPNNQVFAVIEFGGFLGFGEKKRLLSLDVFSWQNDRLVIPGMTEAELRALAAFVSIGPGYRAAEPGYNVNVALQR